LNSVEKTTELCGSSRDLAEEVKAWRIREDFYYLVSAVTLLIPPLRCRKPEILTIADDLLTQYSKQFDRPKPILCKEIVEHLMEHTWPGNLMELQTVIKTFVATGETGANSKGATAANSTDTPQLRQLKNQIRAQRAGIAAARQEQARLQQKIRTYESRIESSPTIEEEYKQIMRDHETAVSMPVLELLDLRLCGVVIENSSALMERLSGKLPLACRDCRPALQDSRAVSHCGSGQRATGAQSSSRCRTLPISFYARPSLEDMDIS
jgi:hypothetical protein